ncbi:MAG: NAD-dependent epimerase/dehydratase family protein [Calditrichaeota bacterium]|nr:NAD-dependent epimerase/dehydratase family protein [Calditrichota bacterium]RQW03181.1 MAG: NAD-dependent epimerase/dehydratase family protein [Calditrichota bacterium]
MAHVFLTGATGFIGSFVAEHLIKNGHRVTCLIRPTSSTRWLKQLPVEYCVGSLNDPAACRDPIQSADVVIHTAGITKARTEKEYYHGNVETTRQLLSGIRDYGHSLKRFVHISSQAAVGPSLSENPVDENSPPHPVTHYGKSKLLSEKVVHSFSNDIPVTIIRPPSVYGPRDREVYKIFRSIKMGINAMVGSVDQLVSLVFVEDLARGVTKAAFSPAARGEIYFLCEEIPYHWSEVADLTGRLMNKKYITLRIPIPLVHLFAFIFEKLAGTIGKATILNRDKIKEIRQPYWVISPRKAQKDFDYKTEYPLEKGLRKTIDWYRENGWL